MNETINYASLSEAYDSTDKVGELKKLVAEGRNIHVEEDWVFRFACHDGEYETAKYLIEQGADVNVDNNYAIKWAAMNDHSDIIELLVENGASLSDIDDWHLDLIINRGHMNTVKYIKQLQRREKLKVLLA